MLTAIAIFFMSLIFVVLLIALYVLVANYSFRTIYKEMIKYCGCVTAFVFSTFGSILATFFVAHVVYQMTNGLFEDEFGLIL